jgi:diguanylate cyclase (GGDEF)-like protein
MMAGSGEDDGGRPEQEVRLDDSAALVLVLASAVGRWRDEATYAMRQTELTRLELERERALRVELEARIAELRTAVAVDELTHVATRGAFDERLTEEFARARRGVEPLALLMIDVDAFKQLNDTYGHPMGDTALTSIGGVLLEHERRPGDLAGRRGGDEFTVVLPGADLDAAEGIAESIRRAVVDLQIANQRSAFAETLTVTIGVAAIVPGETLGPHDLIAAADRSLYLAKERGRNCVAGIELLDGPAQRRADAADARLVSVERRIHEQRERQAELDPDAFERQHQLDATPEGIYQDALEAERADELPDRDDLDAEHDVALDTHPSRGRRL